MNAKKLSRRHFLSFTAAGVAGMILPGTLEAAQRGHTIATMLDIESCINCRECVKACKEANSSKFPNPEKPYPEMFPSRVPVEDWSDKQDVSNRLTPYNWLYIQTSKGTYNGRNFEIHIPRRCLHCQNPPCANLCPWGAAVREVSGTVRINDRICLGGGKCKDVCPWLIPQRQTGVGLYLDLMPRFAGNGVMYKCDRCYQKLAEGELPACIEACPMQLQTIGPRDKILAQARELADDIQGYIYGDQENGGTNTFYVSPVPFNVLNENITTGPGKPHLKPVENTMSKSEYLTAALVGAPLAGLAAGLLSHKADKDAKIDTE
ncbi:4Fe-4S dicluster domain-containing protein [Desulfonatronovibrio magnus]|uniref:4Fe-4S dicluster domain-containing protein n=1 Tax=Desulfonatronovibrio magnus TaxID=698827 RepID=UPI0005EBAFE0|nr:4Fe-4S dicluster domain-containing protein [Desulfonatronovibrio magnus]